MAEAFRRNVIIFGSTGCGKSSVVNMLLERFQTEVAPISSGAEGCTFESSCYNISIGTRAYTLWDTTGLDEGKEGRIVSKDALKQLCDLVMRLSLTDGVSLLIFVMRAPRVTDATIKNYQTFYDGFCEKKVPIVIAVTGLENEENMDAWWIKNASSFEKRNMIFRGSACITAIQGKSLGEAGPGIHAQAYDESVHKVRMLIHTYCASSGWKKSPRQWVRHCWKWIRRSFKSFRPFAILIVEKEAAHMIVQAADEAELGPNFEEWYTQACS